MNNSIYRVAVSVLLGHECVVELDDADAVLAGLAIDQLEVPQHLGRVRVVLQV